mmetsp:Transcript_22550/g.48831  ORF Transcript_22550/g.48831 Transcript_22550/m.48831 type:complete len:451 (-) Transcript_22550:75-1427(-)|eukprot:CAMPEP_0172298768 /NCGR_PEP_ID=MMETSP1058-20130122/1268_1 /TAXON_ID=83371 /ORGANISM="Detonula confervacea, Strain CCMP 353" /LENGTH=450 /DNA_ID=CAMNT_0013008057 /DNA_START=72 /DNA_END=1424 /DNA_ORIENTATION=+
MTSSTLRLSALFFSVCTSDAFTTTTQSQRSSLTSPLGVSKTSEAIPDLSSSTKPLDESSIFDNGYDATEDSSWQKNLDMLLAPDTSVAERQIVLSDLLTSGEQIQDSVRTALKDRKIDGLLTPTQKRLQDGTRAVARQLTSDILPGIAALAAGVNASPDGSKKLKSPVDVLVEDLPNVVPKIGSRVLNAISNQAQNSLKEFQEDIKAGDPLRSISRIQEQTAEIAAEAKNVFAETPDGLVGPSYRVLSQGEGYELREYDSYSVASTSMAKVDEPYTMDDLASGGEAFNALAAYLFGANEEKAVMEMTTPVTTTSSGEMRFYLKERNSGSSDFPMPVAENDEAFNAKGEVKIQEIPSATLAVAKFTGFVTEGEVARQKDALMTCLSIDGIEIDVPHASVVPHVILQYNPPYTIPILRRNEIGIPVRLTAEEEEDAVNLSENWDAEDGAEEK